MPKDHQTSSDTSAQKHGEANRVIPPTHLIADHPTGVVANQPHPTISTKPESSKEQNRSQEKPLPWFIEQLTKPEWITIYVTAIYVIVTLLIWLTMRRQAEDARIANTNSAQTASGTLAAIERQADLMERQITETRDASAQQARDVQASIAEATRVSRAMEGIAVSMATSVESVQESVLITREMADMQRLATELQSRAYLSVAFNTAIFQDANHVFEVQAILHNSGNTPAYDVAFRAVAQIVPIPLPEDFAFPLPDHSAGASESLIAPTKTKLITRVVSGRVPDDQVAAIKRGNPPNGLVMWGIVKYRDAFKQTRRTRFAFLVTWIPLIKGMDKDKDGNPLPEPTMSFDTPHHNDAD